MFCVPRGKFTLKNHFKCVSLPIQYFLCLPMIAQLMGSIENDKLRESDLKDRSVFRKRIQKVQVLSHKITVEMRSVVMIVWGTVVMS